MRGPETELEFSKLRIFCQAGSTTGSRLALLAALTGLTFAGCCFDSFPLGCSTFGLAGDLLLPLSFFSFLPPSSYMNL
jgi:hypothetical protein